MKFADTNGRMIINYTYKFRIYPNQEQKILLLKTFGCVRYVYNHFLAKRIDEYKRLNKSSNYYEDSKFLTQLKKQDDHDWLNEVASQVLQQSLKNLDFAYKRFFEHTSKFPQFKVKNNCKDSFRIVQDISIKNNKLCIPKFQKSNGIKINLHREIEGEICSATIERNKANQYFACILVERNIEAKPKLETEIGIDLGIKTLVCDSNGKAYTNIKAEKKFRKKIKRAQRKLNRRKAKSILTEKDKEQNPKKKESNRVKKQRTKLAKLHNDCKNYRHDNLHKISHQIIQENQLICMEDLAVSNMMKNHKLAKAITDCAWYELTQQIKYKAKWYGREIVVISRWFPSSKTCSCCGYYNRDLKLEDREWDCPQCGVHHERDHNAAKTILQEGKRIYNEFVGREPPELKPVDFDNDLGIPIENNGNTQAKCETGSFYTLV